MHARAKAVGAQLDPFARPVRAYEAPIQSAVNWTSAATTTAAIDPPCRPPTRGMAATHIATTSVPTGSGDRGRTTSCVPSTGNRRRRLAPVAAAEWTGEGFGDGRLVIRPHLEA
eukprot:scaffold19481_cov112-Isochrysis_galbana.AAC.9